ncbi:MAG: DUF3793 family protein [Clostridia bacterium]|nr:DUF3793 family protein [Clostridia bacterium]
MSDEVVVRFCAPTLAAIKTGSLFSCKSASKDELYRDVRSLNKRLKGKGLRILPLRYRDGHGLVYVYRPDRLGRDLMNEKSRQLLEPLGYNCSDQNRCVCCLQKRLNETEEFPHEIGLFLGYPPDDVDGFMNRRGQCCYTGYWKVYSHLDVALKTFATYRHCTDALMHACQKGKRLEEMAV